MTLQPNVISQPSQNWKPCTFQGHLDATRGRHEDLAGNPYDRGAQEALWEAVGELLNHLDGLHAEDVLVELIASEQVVVQTARGERDRMGVRE